MKRVFVLFLALLLAFSAAPAVRGEAPDDWYTAPTLLRAYEISSEKLYIEWEGNARTYFVYMDGQNAATVNVKSAVIPIKNGTHSLCVYPILEEKSADTKLEISLEFVQTIGGSLELDLGALGLDPKKQAVGIPSARLDLDYTVDSMFNAAPDKPEAATDGEDRVLLTFQDRYQADEYLVAVQSGKDVNYVRFSANEPEAGLAVRSNSSVTLILDPDYLRQQGCMIPELGREYSFSVKLRKYAVNLLDRSPLPSVMHESKTSKKLKYTPLAAWKTAPLITYASQTQDGRITLEWEHESYGRACEYEVLKNNRLLGVTTGQTSWGITGEHRMEIDDLANGTYHLCVRPLYDGEKGAASASVAVEVENQWMTAPRLTCVQTAGNQVELTWPSAAGVDVYHLTVYAADGTSWLRYFNLNDMKIADFDVPYAEGTVKTVFTLDTPEKYGEKVILRFRIYGVHYAADGKEQTTSVSIRSIDLE